MLLQLILAYIRSAIIVTTKIQKGNKKLRESKQSTLVNKNHQVERFLHVG